MRLPRRPIVQKAPAMGLPRREYVRVRLDDGAVVELSHRAAEDIYDLLWLLAPAEGAVTTAAKLHHALRLALLETVELDSSETARFAEARERIGAD